MIVLRILKIFFFGIVGQIVIWSLLTVIVSPVVGFDLYRPWLNCVEWLFPSGPGSHAFPGGAILGFLIGFLVYSIIIGFGIDYFIKWKLAKSSN